MWFRIELDRSGAILNCTEVPRAEKGSMLLKYVAALSREEVLRLVGVREARKANKREYVRNLQQARRAGGLCLDCGTPTTSGKCRCDLCREKANATSKIMHLPTVLREFDALGPEKFREWLVSKISARKVK